MVPCPTPKSVMSSGRSGKSRFTPSSWTPPDESLPQVERLRGQIRERWHARVRQQLQLTDQQAAKLQATEDRYFERRRADWLAERLHTKSTKG